MDKINLDAMHPDLEQQLARYIKWGDIYAGADAIEGKSEYLPRHALERDAQYNFRLTCSCYRNYAKSIVGVWHSHIWRKAPARVILPDQLFSIEPNVDMQNASADSFFRKITKRALADGVAFVLVDSPRVNANGPITLADSRRRGIRPYFIQYGPEHVIDWAFETGEDGTKTLKYAVVKESAEVEAEPFQNHIAEVHYRLWTRKNWQVWRYVLDKNKGKAADLVDEGTNAIGEVPLVPFYYDMLAPMVGNSLLADIASICLRIFRKESEKDIAEYYTNVPFFYFRGWGEEEFMNAVAISSTNLLRNSNSDATIELIESTGRAIESTRASLQEDHNAILEIALRQLQADTKQVRSYESKQLDKIQLDTQLARFAKDCSEAEAQCWRLAAKWMQIDNPEIDIKYNQDYDIEKVSTDLLNALLTMRGNRDLSQETLWEMLRDGEILPESFDNQEEKARLATDNTANSFATLAQRAFQRTPE